MFDFEVLGIKDVNFKEDATGRPVIGVQLWVVGKTGDAAWLDGREVAKIWIPDGHPLESTANQLKLGDQIRVTFDRKGKPMTLEVVQ